MIIFLNGSINAGKTTVAKILAEKIDKLALVEVDVLRAMIPWVPINEAVLINLENAVSITRNLAMKGHNVLVVYPLLKRNYEYVLYSLADLHTPMHFFTLSPRLEVALTNRGTRELDEKEKERIKYHYDVGIPTPSFGEIIDNSEQTGEETARIILDKLKIR